MTQEMGTRPNGAPAAILAVPFPRVDTNAHVKGGCLRRFAAADTSYVIVRASFSPIRHSKQTFSFYWRPKSLARTREAYSGKCGIGLLDRPQNPTADPVPNILHTDRKAARATRRRRRSCGLTQVVSFSRRQPTVATPRSALTYVSSQLPRSPARPSWVACLLEYPISPRVAPPPGSGGDRVCVDAG